MCGLVGFMGDFNAANLKKAVMTLSHRGPDDNGMLYMQDQDVGLGHARLSIQDLSSSGHQPMLSADSLVSIVFNGEIYNFKELRSELINQGYQFNGNSDTEVVLNLYLRDGENMLPSLNGIFSIAVYDERKKHLFIARDGLGVKPLYYAELNEGFAFASEIKALLKVIPTGNLNIPALHSYLTFLWCPGESTPLNEVVKLSPGEALLVRGGAITKHWKWYMLPIKKGLRPRYKMSENDAINGTIFHLNQAVKRQLVSDVPVGAFLSGGLDSSSIVAFARESVPDIKCFTILSKGEDAGVTNDYPYARRVAKNLGVSLDVIEVESSLMADDIEKMVYMLDEPLADPASLNVLYISKLARENGIKVLLSGAGGDDLFTGYRRHVALGLERWWGWLPQGVRRHLTRGVKQLDQRKALGRQMGKMFAWAGDSADERLIGYFTWANDSILKGLYTSEFKNSLGSHTASERMSLYLDEIPNEVSRLDMMLALEQRFFLADHNLTYTDKMSMAAGVEVRVPFLDLDLVEFADRIPDHLKQKGQVGKWVLKKAMESYLPHDVIYRKKTGFGVPLRRWIRHELREILGDYLSAESLRSRGLFDPMAVQTLIKDNEEGRVDAAYTLFSLLCIEIWCRHFIDGSTVINEYYD